jgi:hypothetical protein
MRIKPSIVILIFTISTGCKIEYRPQVKSPTTGYLVVEGFINSGGVPDTITLSRTIKVYDDSVRDIYEHNALVSVEGENNESFPLYETGNGIYTCGALPLNSTEKYRLKIKTNDGKEYASDFSDYRTTPDIDSLSWQRNSDGVKIYINTHDDQNQPGYYYWTYEETWEIHSAFFTDLQYVFEPGDDDPYTVGYINQDQSVDSTLYECWPDVKSSNINIGSSEKLSRDVIYFPIMSIEPKSRKLSVLYSIKVKQHGISKEAYRYFSVLKTNSEEIGSITGPLPSKLPGNIHSISNPSEIVIGFVEVSQEKESKRLFISNQQLPGWGYTPQCFLVTVDNNPVEVKKNEHLYPTLVAESIGPGIKSFFATQDRDCMDCTEHGSSVKPAFWP